MVCTAGSKRELQCGGFVLGPQQKDHRFSPPLVLCLVTVSVGSRAGCELPPNDRWKLSLKLLMEGAGKRAKSLFGGIRNLDAY